jgi:hypothetical protein
LFMSKVAVDVNTRCEDVGVTWGSHIGSRQQIPIFLNFRSEQNLQYYIYIGQKPVILVYENIYRFRIGQVRHSRNTLMRLFI